MASLRLQKYMSESGFCSRRKAEILIKNRRVKVNSDFAVIGMKVEPFKDIVTVDGEKISVSKKKEFKYILMNKPRGYITTMNDEKDRKCVADLLKDFNCRVYPVGRLDVNSEGLLLFTNDGEFANDLMHPSRDVSKLYRVTLKSSVTEDQIIKLSEGVEIDGRKTMPANIHVITKEPNRTVMEVVIKEGRNRQIRKMCEVVGLHVVRLKRVAIGPLRLGMLKPGDYRELKKDELRSIRTAIKKPLKNNKS